jgi:hypothetical protein
VKGGTLDKKIYKCKCGICGHEWECESEFLSVPFSTFQTSDGLERLIVHCENLQGEPLHTAEQRRKWYKEFVLSEG